MTWVAGADGFKRRWMVVLWHADTAEIRTRVVDAFTDLFSLPENPAIVAVDIPIGLPETTMAGGRTCEREARRVLCRKSSSVFSAVGRAALTAPTRQEADRISRTAGGIGVGAQAWGLAQKLREADGVMTPAHQSIVHEVHPEVSFWALQGGEPLLASKKTLAGVATRVEVLSRGGFQSRVLHDHLSKLRVGHDDFLDACAAAWTALRIMQHKAGRFPIIPECDGRGLDMAIWY